MKFGRLVHNGLVMKAENDWTTSGTGSLKWQCSANCYLFYL